MTLCYFCCVLLVLAFLLCCFYCVVGILLGIFFVGIIYIYICQGLGSMGVIRDTVT